MGVLIIGILLGGYICAKKILFWDYNLRHSLSLMISYLIV